MPSVFGRKPWTIVRCFLYALITPHWKVLHYAPLTSLLSGELACEVCCVLILSLCLLPLPPPLLHRTPASFLPLSHAGSQPSTAGTATSTHLGGGQRAGGDLNAAAIARELEQLTYLLLFSNRGDDSSLFRNSKINGCWFYLSEIKKKIGAKFENV